MNFLDQFLGKSSLQEDFRKWSGLKWKVLVHDLEKVVLIKGENSIRSNLTNSFMLFDFKAGTLIFADELKSKFQNRFDTMFISGKSSNTTDIEFFITDVPNGQCKIKFIIKRNAIKFINLPLKEEFDFSIDSRVNIEILSCN